jgi:HTH-type transcriptional regulator / antitoxin HigA
MTHGTLELDRYQQLLVAFPPRPIKSEADLDAIQKVIDSLIDKSELSADEREYLSVLGSLVSEYEQKYHPIPDISGVDLLKVLIEEQGLKQKDLLPIFKTESIVSDVLHGKRKLTVGHIKGLAEFFKVPASVFL